MEFAIVNACELTKIEKNLLAISPNEVFLEKWIICI